MKKLNQRGFSHIEILIVAAIIIVAGVVGFFVYNKTQNKSSRAESRAAAESAEPASVDEDVSTLTELKAADEQRASKSFKTVVNRPAIGQAFACKVGNNFRQGVKYYFKGRNAGAMWVNWDVHVPKGGAGAGGVSPKLQRTNTVKIFKMPGSAPARMVMEWRFVIQDKNNSRNRAASGWIEHTNLPTCP